MVLLLVVAIERLELLTPGNGYTIDEPIKVKFSTPDLPIEEGGEKGSADIVREYEVADIQIVNPGTGYASEKPLLIGIDPPPLTARLNLNDPMVVKNLSLNTSSSSGANKMMRYMTHHP